MRRRTRLRRQGLNRDGLPADLTPQQRQLLNHLRLRRDLKLHDLDDDRLLALVRHPDVQEALKTFSPNVTALFITHVGRLPTEIRQSKVVF